MDQEAFHLYVKDTVAKLDAKITSMRQNSGIGDYDSYEYSQDSGLLHFSVNQKIVKSYRTVFIGSLVEKEKSWLWGWANPSLKPVIKKAAEKIKGLEEFTGLPIFSSPAIQADEGTAYELSAMAIDYLGAMGLYRHQGELSSIYFAMIEELEIDPH
jgi:hypothetical protein